MVGNDLTQGRVSKTLIRFTFPFFCGTFLHTLYSIVDMFIVGQYASAADMAAVSNGALIMYTVNTILTGYSTGATVFTGQIYGAKQEKNVRETISTIFCFFPLLAILLLALGLIFRHPLLGLLNTPAESYGAAEAYVRICMYGVFFTGFFCAIASVLRGMGDSTGPTIFVSVSCVLNVIGDYFTVKVLGWGAAGAALATTVSQGCSVLIGLIYLKKRKFPFDFRPKSFRIFRDKLIGLVRMGTPTACQELLSCISFWFIEAMINNLGYFAAAAAGVADRVFSLGNVLAQSFSAATAAMVAQNIGAGRQERAHQSMRLSVVLCTAFGFVIMLIMWAVPEKIVGLFTKDADVITYGVQYLTFYKVDNILYAPALCLIGYINGLGRTRYTMFINLISALAVRLPLVWLITRIPGTTLREIGLSLPVASIAQLLLAGAFLLFWKGEREYRSGRKLRA